VPSKHKKILVNALSARQGGGQTYVINLLKFLPKECSLEILVLAQDSLLLPMDSDKIKKLSLASFLANPFVRFLWERWRLPQLLRKTNSNVLFCTGGSVACRPPVNCKSVTMFRNMMPFDLKQRRRYRFGYTRFRFWALRRTLLRTMSEADLVICLSKYAKGVLKEQSQVAPEKIAVIPHGIPPSFRRSPLASAPKPSWLPAVDYILYVSNIDHYKAQIEVIQAFAMMKKAQKHACKLVLVGPAYPPYLKRVLREINRLGLATDVVVKGAIPYQEMPGLYQNALVNIFASECENCPNILLEAMAAGRPLLVSNRPPMPEFAGDAAIYFDPRDPKDLASKLSSLLDDSVMMTDLAQRALLRSELYDWQCTADATWKAIEDLCQESTTLLA